MYVFILVTLGTDPYMMDNRGLAGGHGPARPCLGVSARMTPPVPSQRRASEGSRHFVTASWDQWKCHAGELRSTEQESPCAHASCDISACTRPACPWRCWRGQATSGQQDEAPGLGAGRPRHVVGAGHCMSMPRAALHCSEPAPPPSDLGNEAAGSWRENGRAPWSAGAHSGGWVGRGAGGGRWQQTLASLGRAFLQDVTWSPLAFPSSSSAVLQPDLCAGC